MTARHGSRPRAAGIGLPVAYRLGDSTRFRWYSSVVPLAGDTATETADTDDLGARPIPFCGEIGNAIASAG